MSNHIRISGAALSAALAGVLAAAPVMAQDDTISIARDTDFNSLDPSRAWCDSCQIYLTAVYDQLVRVGADNQSLEPRLAAEWEISEDGAQYRLRIDEAATFSDGSPVEAKDVKFSLLRLKNLGSGASFLVSGVDSIETPDPKTVVINLTAPDSEFLGKLSAPYAAVINSDVAREHDAVAGSDAPSTDQAEAWFVNNSAGGGPYVLESYRPDDELRLKVNPNYWRDAPDAGTVVIREAQDAVTQMQMLQSGGADIAMQIDPDTARAAGDSDEVVTELVPSFNFVYAAMAPGAESLEIELTPKVREAVAAAIDYEGVINFVTGGTAGRIAAPIPPGFPGTSGLEPPEQDLEKARSLLEEAGLGDGFTMEAVYPELNVYGVDLSTVMQKLQQDLSKVNIDLELQPVTFSVWLDRSTNEHLPFTVLYYAPDYYGSGQYTSYFTMTPGTTWYARAGGDDAEGLLNEKAVKLRREVSRADSEKAADLYHSLAEEMMAERVILPLLNPSLVLAHGSDIEGVRYAICCNLPIEELSKN